MIETFFKDMRYGILTIAKRPGFAIVAVLSLALGIGANTAIFTLVEAVMLRSLPVRSPDELLSVGDSSRPTALRTGGPMLNIFSYPVYKRLRDNNRVFSGLLASGKTGRVDMRVGDGVPEEVRGRLVSGNYFEVLGVSPAIGRVFSSSDDAVPGGDPVIVISYDFWDNRFGRNSGILGQSISLNGTLFTVIGVGPPDFTGEVVGMPTDVWVPLTMQAQLNPGNSRLDSYDANWLLCIGRRLPGVSIDRAREEMTTLGQQAIMDYSGANLPEDVSRNIRSQKVDVQPGAKGFSAMRKKFSQPLTMLMVLVGLLLLIACANVANLLLARSTSRRQEIALRLAIGASRWRLIRQLLTEGLVLAAAGGLAGLFLAGFGSRLLLQLVFSGPDPLPLDVSPNITVLAFTLVISFLTALIFGLIPALVSTRFDLAPTLKESGHGQGGAVGGRLGKLLVVGQLALSLFLLIGAGLFIRSLANLDAIDVGYSRANLVLLKTDMTGSSYTDTSQQIPLVNALTERLSSIPGVMGVTVSENGLFSGTDSGTGSLVVDGFTPSRKEDSRASFDQVGPHYFQVVGVPVLAGRDFNEGDKIGARPVAIINDTMAEFYFGKRDPMETSIVNGKDRYTIVGVVKDMKERDLKNTTERRFYIPMLQSADLISDFNFEIRTRNDATSMVSAVRHEMQAFNPNLKILSLEPISVLIDRSISEERLIAELSGFFSLLALLLAANGVYGVTSYAMSLRANEIGIRMALGASRFSVIRMVLSETLTLVLLGIAIGLPGALVATRLVAARLVGLSATDPIALTTATLVMLAIAMFASFIPAQNAARMDPWITLRQE